MKFRLDGFLQAVLGGKSQARITSVSAPFLYAQGGIFRRVVDLRLRVMRTICWHLSLTV